ncbi:MAG: hypothetical protein ACOYMH_08200 [Zwartia sp.]
MLELTPEQEVQRSYNAAMDSVNLLNAGKPEKMTAEDWADTVKRNVEHLKIQIAKGDYYAGYDLSPFKDAVK